MSVQDGAIRYSSLNTSSIPSCEDLAPELDTVEVILGRHVFRPRDVDACTVRKACWVFLNVILAAGSYTICYPSAKAAHQSSEKLGVLYAAGAFLNWGTFTYFGMAEWASMVFSDLTDEEKFLFRARLNTAVRTSLAAAGLIGGIGSRLPGAAVGLIFTNTWFWALLPLLFEAGVPAYSLTKKLESGVEKIVDCFEVNPSKKELESVKAFVISRINFSLIHGLKMDAAARVHRFHHLFLDTAHERFRYGARVLELMKEIKLFHQVESQSVRPSQVSRCVVWPRTGLQVIFSTLALGLLVQNSVLADIAVQKGYDKTWAQVGGVALAVIPMCWVALNLPGMSAKHIYDLIMDSLGIERSNKTFSEQFYPKTIKLLTTIELFFAWMIYGGISQIAKSSMDYQKQIGKEDAQAVLNVIIASNFITLFLMIVHSYMHYTDTFIQKYTRTWGDDPELQNAIQFKDLLENFRDALEKMKPVNFALLLESIRDSEVKRYYLSDRLTQEALQEYLLKNTTERTALLQSKV